MCMCVSGGGESNNSPHNFNKSCYLNPMKVNYFYKNLNGFSEHL